MNKTEEIPNVLLQEGHKYTFGEFPPPVESTPPKPKERPTFSPESEYVPSFLAHEPEKDDFVSDLPDSKLKSVKIEKQVDQTLSEEPLISQEGIKLNTDHVAGSFIVALAEYGDVYLSKKDDIYSVEYTMGRIDFNVKDSEIDILSTQRISDDDETIQKALDNVKRITN